MNWDALGAIGELVGATAVVLTLAYLALQIRQTNRATRSESIQESTTAFNEINGWVVNDELVARIFLLGSRDINELSEEENIRFSFFLLSTFHVFETIFPQNRFGTIDQSIWESELGSLRYLMAKPGITAWWNAIPLSFSSDFREFVHREIQH
jgi:hypothetical protein